MDMIQSLIDEINKRKDLGIIEETNANLLIKLISNAETNNEAVMIAELGTMYKKTGLFFDVRLEKIGEEIKYLSKNKGLSFDNGDIHHKLIIGDNYDALQNLLISYKGKIDVIYIDPPYGCDNMGEFADTNYENNITRDNLLSMLYPRLTIAKNLLSEEGVIFCSIDDKNYAYIKCLFDEIFSERNFIASLCKKGAGGKQDSKTYSTVHEYVLLYAKNASCFTPAREEKELVGFNEIDEKGRYYKTQLLRKWGDNSLRENRPNLFYPIFYNPNNNSLSLEKRSDDDIEILPINDGKDGCWRWEKTTMAKAFTEGRVEIKKKDDEYVAYEKLLKEEAEVSKPYTTWLDQTKNDGAKILKEILGSKVFDYPKPVDLILTLLKMVNSRNSIILDFFAGSGTTGHAVLELNKLDNGNRTFILCTNNEKNDLNPNGIANDVTSRRLKRIMSGEDYDGSNDFAWLKTNAPYGDSLDVYEIKEVNEKERTDGKSPFEVIDETNYDLPKFDTLQSKIEWVCQNFENTKKSIEE